MQNAKLPAKGWCTPGGWGRGLTRPRSCCCRPASATPPRGRCWASGTTMLRHRNTRQITGHSHAARDALFEFQSPAAVLAWVHKQFCCFRCSRQAYNMRARSLPPDQSLPMLAQNTPAETEQREAAPLADTSLPPMRVRSMRLSLVPMLRMAPCVPVSKPAPTVRSAAQTGL